MQSREIHLVSRPEGMPVPDNFKLVTVDVPDPAPGEVQVRNILMSVDPAMRGRMYEGRSYVAPYGLNEVMEARAIGVVTASNAPGFAVGDHVGSSLGWREAFTAPADQLEKIDLQGMPPGAFMNLAGSSGRTAYLGMTKIAGLKPGDVVFVSAAAGSVGSIAAQIAKLKGHKVIGSAGGPEKAAFLTDELGLDAAIDYRGPQKLTKALAEAAPEGIDVYFDNVGGEHLQAAIAIANPFARFAVCGMISQYNDAGQQTGPRNLTQIMGKCIRMEGFLMNRYEGQLPDFERDIVDWYRAGKLKSRETVHEGIDHAVDAFLGVMRGENLGKMLVRLGD
jgi:NADPH-dependent curcumin reductase CurA